jgi:two-component system, OmpR family, copper resistance phosphate regulon response regulator CusR
MGNCRILVVEDDHRIADTLRYGLSENGFDVEAVYSGNTGLDTFLQRPFDLIILDINLPGINGYELCQRIRQVNSGIPVIMLTALGTLADKIEGYDAGADDYLLKPFEFRELLVKIRVLLRRTADPNTPTGNVLHAGDLTMNLETKSVEREGRAITLTAKEFQLLEYFLRNKNKVVSRTDIAVDVWNIRDDANTNIIDVYINYLRNKMDKPFSEKLLVTFVGAGYMLKEKP